MKGRVERVPAPPAHATGPELERRLERLERYARWLDASVGVPGTRIRLGVDSLVGLVPLVGDWAGVVLSLPIVREARRLGVSRSTWVRMLGNLALEATVGAVPVVGDLFDVWFRANQRNVALLVREARRRADVGGTPPPRVRESSRRSHAR